MIERKRSTLGDTWKCSTGRCGQELEDQARESISEVSSEANTLRETHIPAVAGVQPMLEWAQNPESREREEEDRAGKYHVGLRKR